MKKFIKIEEYNGMFFPCERTFSFSKDNINDLNVPYSNHNDDIKKLYDNFNLWHIYKPENFEYKGKWIFNWFSNMIPFDKPLIYQNIKFYSVENFYQAMKIDKKYFNERKYIASLSPHQSKIEIRKNKYKEKYNKNFNNIKLDVMEYALKYKFKQKPFFDILKRTEKEMIIEWNNWIDKFWGVYVKDNKGQNNLGKLLMKIRKEIC